MNKVILLGNLGADPERVTRTRDGQTVARMSLGINYRGRAGKEYTEWVRVSVFGPQADSVLRYMSKGRQVLVEGRLHTSEYRGDRGERKWSTEVVASRVQFVNDGRGRGGRGRGSSGGEHYEGF